ncbi:hypothetical protein ACA910_003241 [Epithemia clementina (nom. ined.)]
MVTYNTVQQPQDNDSSALHAKSVNLARRWSVQNEPDLVMENYCGEDEDMQTVPRSDEKKRYYTHKDCETMASHLLHVNQLPTQCLKFQDVTANLKRRDSDTTHGSSVLS